MTSDDAIADCETQINAVIDRYLGVLERLIRLDHDSTGPEDQDALDRPPIPGSPWSRLTVEEILVSERVSLQRWRAMMLDEFRIRFRELIAIAH